MCIRDSGTTDKLPSKVFAVKVDDSTIRLATSAENALKTTPTYLDITAVGVGTSHSFTSTKQNSRCILSIDNIVQSPIVSTAVTTTITADVSATTVAQYETETFNGAYYVVCVEDTTNSHYQISEVIVVDLSLIHI